MQLELLERPAELTRAQARCNAIQAAKARAQLGMDRAAGAVEFEMPGWIEQAVEALRRAASAQVGVFTIEQMRAVLLRGWWQAADGRLYHDVMVEQVQAMLYVRRSGAHRKHLAAVLARDGAMCCYCGRGDLPLTLDHVQPRSKGGADTPDNLALACRPCNSSKGARTPDEWRRH